MPNEMTAGEAAKKLAILMPDILGTRRSIRCSDGRTRTGTVVYINPYRTFATMEFEGKVGKWREAFFLTDPARYCKTADEFKPSQMYCDYTPEEDAEILNTVDLEATAKKLGRPVWTIARRRTLLLGKTYKKFTAAEDREIMKSDNLRETAKKLGRKPGSVWARQQTIRRHKQNEMVT